ncbi:hemerythrin domain-containing protein [Actinocorallia sp. API 0066]|uniref:hemerythrin domain-containing protein n=1 Tax=Actinocorallia sp. API 0066 TaxID=2896846 RepID=UPI001E5D0607|nr:hemerythrin domain-containing protein [Actinocorallia sp. API 0066]MCD0450250.1 hemerythrin domain-containing protein [Actinocorallia sp. API 0066]
MATTDERLTAFGIQLLHIHDRLRAELALLRSDMDAYLDGGQGRPRELLAHCAAFCTALTRHHTGEDDHVFPALAAQYPALAPTLASLREDHGLIADILTRLDALVAEADPADAERVRRELDGLAAIMESHFTYEERKITKALDDLEVPFEPVAFDLPTLPPPRD